MALTFRDTPKSKRSPAAGVNNAPPVFTPRYNTGTLPRYANGTGTFEPPAWDDLPDWTPPPPPDPAIGAQAAQQAATLAANNRAAQPVIAPGSTYDPVLGYHVAPPPLTPAVNDPQYMLNGVPALNPWVFNAQMEEQQRRNDISRATAQGYISRQNDDGTFTINSIMGSSIDRGSTPDPGQEFLIAPPKAAKGDITAPLDRYLGTELPDYIGSNDVSALANPSPFSTEYFGGLARNYPWGIAEQGSEYANNWIAENAAETQSPGALPPGTNVHGGDYIGNEHSGVRNEDVANIPEGGYGLVTTGSGGTSRASDYWSNGFVPIGPDGTMITDPDEMILPGTPIRLYRMTAKEFAQFQAESALTAEPSGRPDWLPPPGETWAPTPGNLEAAAQGWNAMGPEERAAFLASEQGQQVIQALGDAGYVADSQGNIVPPGGEQPAEQRPGWVPPIGETWDPSAAQQDAQGRPIDGLGHTWYDGAWHNADGSVWQPTGAIPVNLPDSTQRDAQGRPTDGQGHYWENGQWYNANGTVWRDPTSAPVDASGVSLERFMAALVGQESGGDYRVVNSRTGASGKFQFMPETWAGVAPLAGLPPNAPMTPENQDAVAHAYMLSLFNQYGDWADVASVWYSGQPFGYYDPDDRSIVGPGEPTIREYVNSILGRAGSPQRMNTGGYTTAPQFMAGDSTARNPNAGGAEPEIIINPTQAPLMVLNNDQTNQMMRGGGLPRYASGTWSPSAADIYGTAPAPAPSQPKPSTFDWRTVLGATPEAPAPTPTQPAPTTGTEQPPATTTPPPAGTVPQPTTPPPVGTAPTPGNMFGGIGNWLDTGGSQWLSNKFGGWPGSGTGGTGTGEGGNWWDQWADMLPPWLRDLIPGGDDEEPPPVDEDEGGNDRNLAENTFGSLPTSPWHTQFSLLSEDQQWSLLYKQARETGWRPEMTPPYARGVMSPDMLAEQYGRFGLAGVGGFNTRTGF